MAAEKMSKPSAENKPVVDGGEEQRGAGVVERQVRQLVSRGAADASGARCVPTQIFWRKNSIVQGDKTSVVLSTGRHVLCCGRRVCALSLTRLCALSRVRAAGADYDRHSAQGQGGKVGTHVLVHRA